MRHFVRLIAIIAGLPFAALAQAPITTPREEFGQNFGDDYFLANYQQIATYWRKLDAESDRMQVVEIGKTSALAISVGDRLFWDATNKVVNKTATAQQCVGIAVEAAANPSATVKMLLGSNVPVAT